MREGKRRGCALTVIYADILVTINLAVDYLLLFAAARIAGAEFRRLCGLLGAAAGAIYSLIIFLNLPVAALALTRIAASSVMVLITFGRRTFSEFIRLLMIFYICSFLFSGFMVLLNTVLRADSFFAGNGIIYFEFSAVGIVLSGAAAFLVTELLRRLFRRGEPEGVCTVKIFYNQRSAVLKGFTDTGNDLSDPFTGAPVAVCMGKSLSSVLPEEMLSAEEDYSLSTDFGMRLIPCKTVSGNVLIPAFKPDRLVVEMDGTQYEAEDALIGLSRFAPENTLILGKNLILKQAGKGFSEVR